MLLTIFINYIVDEQNNIFDKIIKDVSNQKAGIFFMHGHGETSQTFMWQTLASYLRSKHQIVLTVASSGVVCLLLHCGRTSHSKFKIHVPTLDTSLCNIEPEDGIAYLLRQTQLIIWDEALVVHKHCFEALDRSLREIMGNHLNSESIFDGKVMVFGGDFRQMLPIVPRGTRSDIVHNSLNAS